MKHRTIYPTLLLILVCAVLWAAPVQAIDSMKTYLYTEDAAPALYGGDLWRRTELYFGTEQSDGTPVTEAEFAQFVDDVITPRFPDGLTLLTGYGQFRNAEAVIIEEQSFVLILLYPRDDKEANGEIEEIRALYKDAFEQESVLRVDSVGRVSF